MPPDQPHRDRYLVLVWFCVGAALAYIQRTAIGVAAPAIRDSLNLSIPAMGAVMSGYYWTYALSQLPAGWIGQRFGSRLLLPLSMGGTSLMTLFAAASPTSSAFSLAWLFAGMAIAGIFPGYVQSIVRWFPTAERAFPSGALGCSMSIGGAISTALTGALLTSWAISSATAWRWVFLVYAIPGLLWAAGIAVWFREHPPAVPVEVDDSVTDAQPDSSVATSHAMSPALLDYDGWWFDHRTWLICGQQFFRAAGYVFYATWFPSYLQETRGVSTAVSGALTSMPLIGVVIGGLVGGWAIDHIERRTQSKRISRQLVGVVTHGLCGLLILAAQPIRDPTLAVTLISLGSLVFAVGGACSYAISMDLGGSRTATLFALMNTCGNIGAALCPLVVGQLIPILGWEPLLLFFGAIYVAASACWMFLNPTAAQEPV